MYNDPSESSQIADSPEPNHPANLGIITDPRHVDVCVSHPPTQLSNLPSVSVLSVAFPRTLHLNLAEKRTGLCRCRVSCSMQASEVDAGQLPSLWCTGFLPELHPPRHPTTTADQSQCRIGGWGHHQVPLYINADQK